MDKMSLLNDEENELANCRVRSQNIIDRLKSNEINGVRANLHPYFVTRPFHQTIIPNLTVCGIEKPPCFIRKFTPDGRHLIAFSGDQTSVEIYQYNGAGAGNDLLLTVDPGTEFTKRKNTAHLNVIRQQMFGRLFTLKHTITVATNGEQLNRECSLFVNCLQYAPSFQTPDNLSDSPEPSTSTCTPETDPKSNSNSPPFIDKSKPLIKEHQYLIVGSAQFCPEDNYPHYYDIFSNNESISLSARSALEDYTLYLINIEEGRMTDKRVFKVDKIFLSHNQGVYLYRNTLAVLSIQHQTIHLFEIDFLESGAVFVEMKKIGRFCYEDDEYLVNSAYAVYRLGPRCPPTSTRSSNPPQPPTLQPPNIGVVPAFRESPINALKHRILAFLYRRSMELHQIDPEGEHLLKFNESFDRLLSLRMWKIQLLNQNHILIKYTHEEVITLRISDINSLPTMFVIYDHKTTQVLDVFQNRDDRLLDVYERFNDNFRNANCTYRVYRNFNALRPNNTDRQQADPGRPSTTNGHHDSNTKPNEQQQPTAGPSSSTQATSSQDSTSKEDCDSIVAQFANSIGFVSPNQDELYDSSSDYSSFFIDHAFQFVSSASNNIYSAAMHRKFRESLFKISQKGEQEAIKRVASQIPISAQSFNCSPYLDFSLFAYEEKWISPLERPKQCDDFPIRFYDRSSGRLAFRLHPGVSNQWDLMPLNTPRLLAAFTFHPHEPFIISIQRNNQEYIVNLHLRHGNTL